MKANELRIGNLILFYKDVIEINYINKTHIGYGKGNFAPISFNNFEPIPLTEEWLIKLGFEKKQRLYVLSFLRVEINKYINGKWEYTLLFNDIKKIKEIKYVHKLQNLYFELTGEELTIKTI